MAFKIRLRNDTYQNWIEKNPILSKGEVAIELQEDDSRVKLKVGNGVSTYIELPYFNDPISYESLSNKPKLNGFELNGDKPLADYGIQPLGSYLTLETALEHLELKADKSNTYTKSEVDAFFDALIKLPEIGSNTNKFLKLDSNGKLYWSELSENIYTKEELDEALGNKVDKIDGYSLISDADKTKLSGLENFDPTPLIDEDKALWEDVKKKAYTSDIEYNYYNKSEIDTTLDGYAKREDVAGKANASELSSHITNLFNPHNVTKAQVGLGNVDNTSDMDKPVSNATQEALDNKQDSMTIGFGLSLVDGVLKNINPNVNPDWNAVDGDAYIINKPELSKVALSNNYNDLDNKPIIPTPYELPIASNEMLGGIMVSEDFNIDEEGYLKANYPEAFLNYNALQNKPSIWGIDEDGNEQLYEFTQGMTKADLDIAGRDETQSALNLKADKTYSYSKAEIDNKIDAIQAGMVDWGSIGGNPMDNPTLRSTLNNKANVDDLVATNQTVENLSQSLSTSVSSLEDEDTNIWNAVNTKANKADVDTAITNVNNAITTLDNNAVHKTGNEDINGTKTFNVLGTQLYIKASNLDSTTTPSSYTETSLDVKDKNDIRVGDFGVAQLADGTIRTYLCASRKVNDVQKYVTMDVCIKPDGTSYTYAPTPSENSNTTEIANTAWVRTNVNTTVNDKFQMVTSLPSNPDAETFYFIPEG